MIPTIRSMTGRTTGLRLGIAAACVALASSLGTAGVHAQVSFGGKGDPVPRTSIFRPEAAALRTTIPSPTAVNPSLLGPSFLLPVPSSSERAGDSSAPPGASTVANRSEPEPVAPAGPVAPQEDVWRDAWGQPKNFGLAAVTGYLGNFLPWVFNEVVPGRAELKISQISPRSWWRNIEHGFEWDDNAFQVNHFAHPFQGGIYYNAGRSNGFGYWTSLAFATAGKLFLSPS